MQIRPAVKDPTFSGEKAKTQNRSFKVFPPSFEMHGETEIQNRQKKTRIQGAEEEEEGA